MSKSNFPGTSICIELLLTVDRTYVDGKRRGDIVLAVVKRDQTFACPLLSIEGSSHLPPQFHEIASIQKGKFHISTYVLVVD